MNHFEHGRQRALNELAPKFQRLGNSKEVSWVFEVEAQQSTDSLSPGRLIQTTLHIRAPENENEARRVAEKRMRDNYKISTVRIMKATRRD